MISLDESIVREINSSPYREEYLTLIEMAKLRKDLIREVREKVEFLERLFRSVDLPISAARMDFGHLTLVMRWSRSDAGEWKIGITFGVCDYELDELNFSHLKKISESWPDLIKQFAEVKEEDEED